MAKKLFDFDAEFRLGIDVIDQEHVKLVDMLNAVHSLISEGKKDQARRYFSETLSGYVTEHFANEEQFMESMAFPGLEEHKKIHENFKKSFEELKPKIELYDDTAFRSALSDAFTWIVGHIGRTDRKYARFYLAQAVA
jgi:hemerythrin